MASNSPYELVSFSLMWCGSLTLMAFISGWRSLAEQYPAATNPSDCTWPLQSARLGWTRYNGCLNIGVSDEGLYLSAFPLFRPGHPPILIPWHAIEGVDESSSWFVTRTVVRVGAPTHATIELAGSWYPEIEPRWSAHRALATRRLPRAGAAPSSEACGECGFSWPRGTSNAQCPMCGARRPTSQAPDRAAA